MLPPDKPGGPPRLSRPAGTVPACEVDFAGKSADFAKLLRRRQGQPPLFLPVLGRYISRLDDFRGALAANDRARLHAALEDGVAAKAQFGKELK